MAHVTDLRMSGPLSAAGGREDDRRSAEMFGSDAARSNFFAFILGGFVIAGGMLAFLYYDSDNVGRSNNLTTGSIGRLDVARPAPMPNITVPAPPPAQTVR